MMPRLRSAPVALMVLLLPATARAQADIINTIAGGGPNNLPPLLANLDQPVSVAVDASGNIFIASRTQHRVFKVDTSRQLLTVFAGNGTPGFSGDDGPAASAALTSPGGVAVGAGGNVFIADTGNNRVRRVEAASGKITTVAGTGEFEFDGDGGPAIKAKMRRPIAVAVDSSGNLFIADIDNNRIRRVAAGSGTITTVAGNGTPGFSGDGGPAIVASLNSPTGVAVDSSGNVFIADSGNNRVRRVDRPTQVITTWVGNLSGRLGVSVDGSGKVLIADADNGFVRRADIANPPNVTIVAGNGLFGFAGDGGPATSASLRSPLGVTVATSGIIIIADTANLRIRQVDAATQIITTVAGSGLLSFSGDGSDAINASLNSPAEMVVDSFGNVFIADTNNQRIRRRQAASGRITTVAGNGTAGFGGDGGLATSASLNFPAGVAVDTSGNLFILDTANQRVRKVDAATGTITTFAGNGTSGDRGDGGLATSASFNFPLGGGVAVDGSGNVFIADSSNHRIRKVTIATGIITTVAGNGMPGFNGDGPATSASLNFPARVAVDISGNLYIADTSNHRIRKVATGTITTVAGNGMPGFSGDGGPATNASLNFPSAVAVDAALNIFVADQFNERIRRVDGATGTITTVAGNGTLGFTGDGDVGTKATMASPRGIAVDTSRNLYIADTFNNRIRRVINPVVPAVSLSATTLSFPGQLVGTTSAAQTVTLSNTGNVTLNVSSIAASGIIVTSDFSQTNNCDASLAAGANCTINVKFAPTARGTRPGTVTITDDAPGSPHTVSLSGTGIQPVVALSPISLSFSSQLVGTTSAAQTVTLSNTGDAPLNINSIATNGDFAQTNACGGSVATGASCAVTITFRPNSGGDLTGALTVSDSAPGSPHTVALSGAGMDFSTSASSTSATVGAGQTAIFTLGISSLGGFNQPVTLTCTGAPQAATCSVTPSSVTPSGASPTTATITVSTTARLAALPGRHLTPWIGALGRLPALLGLISLAMFITFAMARRRRAWLALAALILAVATWGACGGGEGSGLKLLLSGTPAGTFTLTVTATSGSLSHTTNLTLTVN